MTQEAKERPILFSGPMVRAILEGKKTQTRRVVKRLCGCPDFYAFMARDPYPYYFRRKDAVWDSFKSMDELAAKYSPHGKPGDRLWVRETFSICEDEIIYRTDYSADYGPKTNPFQPPWRPSIFMPRWASRILLEITDVRLERLQSISEADAIAEGVDSVEEFRILWDSINGKKCPWDSNPWVWVLSFKVSSIDPK